MKDKKDMYLWLQVDEDVTEPDIRSALSDKGITRCILHPLPEYDWSSFRREAAKDILPSLIEKASEVYELESLNKEIWCEKAVKWADELIRQLKQE